MSDYKQWELPEGVMSEEELEERREIFEETGTDTYIFRSPMFPFPRSHEDQVYEYVWLTPVSTPEVLAILGVRSVRDGFRLAFWVVNSLSHSMIQDRGTRGMSPEKLVWMEVLELASLLTTILGNFFPITRITINPESCLIISDPCMVAYMGRDPYEDEKVPF